MSEEQHETEEQTQIISHTNENNSSPSTLQDDDIVKTRMSSQVLVDDQDQANEQDLQTVKTKKKKQINPDMPHTEKKKKKKN